MHDLLISSYDLIFRELHYTASKASPEQREQLERILSDINQETMQISKEIIEKPNSELAELTRHDNKTAEVFRSRINNMVDKYMKATEELFKSIY